MMGNGEGKQETGRFLKTVGQANRIHLCSCSFQGKQENPVLPWKDAPSI